jgi:hypothetical protein
VKTYVDGSAPGEMEKFETIRASGRPAASQSIPSAGKAGSDPPDGTGITYVLPVAVTGRGQVSSYLLAFQGAGFGNVRSGGRCVVDAMDQVLAAIRCVQQALDRSARQV